MENKKINNRDKIIVELLFQSYPNFKSAEELCMLFSEMHRKSKSIRNARAMGQVLRKFKLVNNLMVIQHSEGYKSICRYQLMYRLKEFDYKMLEAYDGKPTDSIMSSLLK